ncbi:MAG: hypothetical protein C0603_01465 [Denitrovibrio sp.]|nr:MAG: hypothetical protein C0603_01465 [Denitrovibrio sp.]
MENSSDSYNIKMLNGLVVKDLSFNQVLEGITKGKFLPSDFINNIDGDWIHLKESDFFRKPIKKFNGWMVLFVLSSILNLLMLLLLFWQNGRIEQLLN